MVTAVLNLLAALAAAAAKQCAKWGDDTTFAEVLAVNAGFELAK